MPSSELKEFLDNRHVHYTTIQHPTAYTAQETASLAHVGGWEFAKAVIVKIDGKMVMAVLPASSKVDLQRLRAAAQGKRISVAPEADFQRLFPDSEIGAMPPFGRRYGMPLFVDRELTKDQQICFNAGNHHELVRLSYEDFAKLARPEVADFSCA